MTRTGKILAAATIGLGAAVIAVPASAQVEVGVPGVGVRIGGPAYYYDNAPRTYYYDTHYRTRTYPQRVIYDDDADDCTWRMVERVRPDGSVVTVRERDCD